MARPKGSKNKPKDARILTTQEKNNGVGKKHWNDIIFLVIETPKKGQPYLHSYTESEAGAYSMVKLLKELRSTSKFEVVKKPVDWSGPVSIM